MSRFILSNQVVHFLIIQSYVVPSKNRPVTSADVWLL